MIKAFSKWIVLKAEKTLWAWWQQWKITCKSVARRRQNAGLFTLNCRHCTWEHLFFSVAKQKAFDFPLLSGSLQVMDVCSSFPSRSHILPHLLFPHKNSCRWRREASEGWAWGRAERAPCSVCFKPLFGEETFIAGVIYERPDSREN